MISNTESIVSFQTEETVNNKRGVSLCSLSVTIFGLLFYITDVVTDILLALWYLRQGHYLFCILTLVPVYLATAIDLLTSWFRNELSNKGIRFWIQCILLSLVNLWGFKIIYSLLKVEFRAYKSRSVSASLRELLRKKTIRACWLKFNEGAYEASMQMMLQPSILNYLGEISTYQLPFVTECGELEAIFDSLDLPLPVLMSFVMSLSAAVATMANLNTAYRLTDGEEVSSVGVFVQQAWLLLTAVSRILSILMVLLLYPFHTLLVIWLHIATGSIYWYYNFSIEGQFEIERKVKSLLTGIRLFLSPYYLVKWKTMLFMLHVTHFIGNLAATAAWAPHVSSPYTIGILNCIIYLGGTVCCGCIYWRSSKTLRPRSSFVMRRIF